MTKISIIIPSYNQGRFLEDTIVSVLSQNYPEVEIIIMDGGSKDNSVDVIKKYEPYITYWQSQKDKGQSNAINEGFKRATGEFVTWLNSDDVLLPGALLAIDKTIEANPDIEWFTGNVLWMDKNGVIIRVGKTEKENWLWNKRHLFSNGGPTTIMRRSTLEKLGWLREDFHYMMDTELWHRFIANGYRFVRVKSYLWGLRLHENAKMSGHNFKDSALADKNHPSWIQKNKEESFISEHYPANAVVGKIWRMSKVLNSSFYTRFTDRKLLNKNYKDI